MGICSRLCISLLVALCLLLVFANSVCAAGERVSFGEEQKNIYIHLQSGFYASGSYFESEDTKEIHDVTGAFGWQGNYNNIHINVGAFSGMNQFGTIKPYARLSKDIVLRKQRITPFMRLDVTPPTQGVTDTLYDHVFGVEHRWQPSDAFTLRESLTVAGQNGSLSLTTYNVDLSVRLTDSLELSARSQSVFGEFGTEHSAGFKFVLKH